MTEIQEKIKQIILSQKNDVEIPEDTGASLLDSGIIDSFDIVDLVGSIEEKFCIEIDGDDIIPDNFQSIDSIAAMIEKYIK